MPAAGAAALPGQPLPGPEAEAGPPLPSPRCGAEGPWPRSSSPRTAAEAFANISLKRREARVNTFESSVDGRSGTSSLEECRSRSGARTGSGSSNPWGGRAPPAEVFERLTAKSVRSLQEIDNMVTDSLLQGCGFMEGRGSASSGWSRPTSQRASEKVAKLLGGLAQQGPSGPEPPASPWRSGELLPVLPPAEAPPPASPRRPTAPLALQPWCQPPVRAGESADPLARMTFDALPALDGQAVIDSLSVEDELRVASPRHDGRLLLSESECKPSQSMTESDEARTFMGLGASEKHQKGARRPRSRDLTPATDSVWNMDALRVKHETMLVAEAMTLSSVEQHSSASEVRAAASVGRCAGRGCCRFDGLPSCVLVAFGVVPPAAASRLGAWYGWAVGAGIAAMASYSMALAILDPHALYLHLCTTCIALGGLLGLVFLRLQGIQDVIGPRNRPLAMYAKACGFAAQWEAASARHLIAVAAIWAVSVACKLVGSLGLDCLETSERGAPLGMFAVAYALTAALVYCQLHICCGFELAIDSFCLRFFQEGNLAKGIYEWNMLQAMLRRSAGAVEACFLAIATSILAVLMLTLREIWDASRLAWLAQASVAPCSALWAGWVLSPAALIFYCMFMGATVTEKCLRAPSLVNSWITGEHDYIDNERQYFVQYIMQSSAGWYVRGVRLSVMWAVKIVYLFAVVVFTITSQSLRSP